MSCKLFHPVFLTFLLLSSFSLFAEESKDAYRSYPTITFATAERFAPYAFLENNSTWQGIDYDILKMICIKLGIPFQVRAFPRPRISFLLDNGKIDGLVSTSPYSDTVRLKQMWLSDSLYSAETSAFAKKTFDAASVETAEKLFSSELRFGVIKDSGVARGITEVHADQHFIQVLRDEQLLDLLDIQRIDVAVSEDISFIYSARQTGKFDTVNLLVELTSRPVSIALKQSIVDEFPELPEKINKVIHEMKENGDIDNLIVNYLSN